MKPRINFITLAVADLNKAMIFYKEGLGFPTKGIKEGFEDHVLFDLDKGFGLVLYEESKFAETIKDIELHKQTTSKCIISHFAQSKEEVDAILQQALRAGATQIGKPKDEAWGYCVNFADLDGHLWEICFCPHL